MRNWVDVPKLFAIAVESTYESALGTTVKRDAAVAETPTIAAPAVSTRAAVIATRNAAARAWLGRR
jgi:hypothetical protein